jgi:hypothetical protein
MKHLWIPALLVAGIAVQGQTSVSRRATIAPSNDAKGKCKIEVKVDGVAEIEIAGERAELHTLSGNPAEWVRFECSDEVPRLPEDFKFKGVRGRGRQGLLRDPRPNRGVAVIRIEDPKSGSDVYTFDIEWRGFGSTGKGTFGRYDKERVGRDDPQAKRVMDACMDEVRKRADRDYGYRNLEFGRVAFDDTAIGNDLVTGRFIFRRSQSSEEFQFSCSVDLKSAKVRRVELRRW